MFTIPVGDLLSSYDGDSQSFSFEGPIFDGYYEDIRFVSPLSFHLTLMGMGDTIHAQFHDLQATIVYENKRYTVHLKSFEREWKLHPEPDDADDVGRIDSKNMTIDLKEALREELIMETYSQLQ